MSTSPLRACPSGPLVGSVLGDAAGQLWYFDGSLWLPTSAAPTDRQMPQWNATTNDYEFVNPPNLGAIEYLDGTYDPAGRWNFDGTLVDAGGVAANDLQLQAGTLAYTNISPGKRALFVLAGCRYSTAAAVPALQLSGDMSMIAIVQQDSQANDTTIARHAGTGDLEVDNILYSFGFEASTSPTSTPKRYSYMSEHGAGLDDPVFSSGAVGLPPIHNIMEVGFRRRNNVIRFYLNGEPFGDDALISAPTGGTSSGTRFLVGCLSPTGTGTIQFILFSLGVYNRALSDAEFAERYNQTLGPAFGRLPV